MAVAYGRTAFICFGLSNENGASGRLTPPRPVPSPAHALTVRRGPRAQAELMQSFLDTWCTSKLQKLQAQAAAGREQPPIRREKEKKEEEAETSYAVEPIKPKVAPLDLTPCKPNGERETNQPWPRGRAVTGTRMCPRGMGSEQPARGGGGAGAAEERGGRGGRCRDATADAAWPTLWAAKEARDAAKKNKNNRTSFLK